MQNFLYDTLKFKLFPFIFSKFLSSWFMQTFGREMIRKRCSQMIDTKMFYNRSYWLQSKSSFWGSNDMKYTQLVCTIPTYFCVCHPLCLECTGPSPFHKNKPVFCFFLCTSHNYFRHFNIACLSFYILIIDSTYCTQWQLLA